MKLLVFLLIHIVIDSAVCQAFGLVMKIPDKVCIKL
jgi:hypothetical protein